MKQTSRGLAPSLNTGHSTFTGARQRLAVALVAIVIAFAGAQTAGAQVPELKPCKITFDISGEGTVEFRGETVTNSQPIDCLIPSTSALTITPKTGYVVSSVTYDATDGLSIGLNQKDDFQWILNIEPYGGSETPTITVYIVFDKALAGGADEASAVALTADDDLSHLAGGWYKVESDLTLGHTWNLHSDTRITIATGKTLTVSTSDEYGISGSALTVSGEGTLNVSANDRAISVDNYTQMGCAVTLSGKYYGLHAKNNVSISGGSLTTSGAYYGIYTDKGSITISGGTVSSSGDSAGLYANKAVSITGGTVSASGDNYGIRGLSVSITGGQVNVSSGGIYSNYGDITLGCTSATDYITASGYVLQNDGFYVKIADGQTLYGGGFPSASYTGTIVDPSALNGLMLRPTAAVTKSGTNEYTIWNADGWDFFCDMQEAGETFSGKTIVLAGDIGTTEDPVTRMGSNTTQFQGTFDGAGHTLTVQYGTPSEPVNQQFVAPFPKVAGAATFRNLTIAGSIYSGYATSVDKGTGGLIGCLFGGVTVEHCVSTVTVNAASDRAGGFVGHCEHAVTFTDCVSSATVTCTGSGSGFVGWSRDSKYTIAFYGCLFDGKVLKQGTVGSGNGSFVGWKGFSKTVTITNCIAAPATDENMATDNSATFCRYSADTTKDNGETHITNSYYTAAFDIAQGKQARAVTAGTDVTVAHAGVATHYATSGITAYKATGTSADSDPFIEGILYDEVLYAGSGDEVSLTLANSSGDAPAGYQYSGDYSASGGATLSGSTLTMDDEDVTVSFTPGDQLRSTGQAVPVSYIDADGQPASHNAIALDGTEGSLGQNNQETWYYVGTDITVKSRIYLTGDMNLILADGYTLDVKGIYIPQGSTLTIYAESDGETAGKIVSHPTGGAAIGGKSGYDNGNIVIYGGNIEAAGGVNCAGIGSADGRTGGTITIYGGTVTAKGGTGGAAIGGGRSCSGGSITIYGGTVTAKGGTDGAAIGGGQNCSGGTIDIYGGTITANGPTDTDTCENGAGIGGGDCADGGTITIYGGTITTYSRDGAGIGGGDDGDGGTITINGGTITSNKVNQGQGARIGGGLDAGPGTITINGGTITTEGGSGAGIGGGKRNPAGGTVTINGGVINASGPNGIGAGQEGSDDVAITLGWMKATDQIYASSYNGTVTIVDGKSFHNGSEVLAPGTVAASDYESKLNGKTLIGVDVLQDDAANDVAALATRLGGKQTNIALSGRKLWKDGAWNTLVLPFSVADIEADGCPLNGATVRQLSKAYVTGTTLTLNFEAATTAIAAGTPYIVKWEINTEGTEGTEYTEDPVFQGVTIDAEPHNYDNQAGGDTNVRFIGTYDQKTIATEDRSILFLGTDNNLYYPDGKGSGVTIGAFRAYFKIGDGEALARQLTAFNFSWSADGSSASGIADVSSATPADGDVRAPGWYTLDGVKLDGKPTKKGVYILGGKTVVIK